MEPATKLVAAFEVKARRPRQTIRFVENGQVARAGVEPDVENISFFNELSAATPGAFPVLTDQLGRPALVPDIRGVLAEERNYSIQNLAVRDGLAPTRAITGQDRHAPDTLPGDAPIGARCDDARGALFGPWRQPVDIADRFDRPSAKRVALHAGNPLLGGGKDSGIVGPPAVRIAVLDV